MNGRVIFGIFMMLWSVAFAAAGWGTMSGGFNAGMFVFWLSYTSINYAARSNR